MLDTELLAIASLLRRASNLEAGPYNLRHAMADVVEMAVTHKQDADGCYLCETDMRGECVAWCNGVILAMAMKLEIDAKTQNVGGTP